MGHYGTRIFDYSHAYAPMVLHNVTLEVNNHDDSNDFLEGWPASSLKAYYRKLAALVL